MTLPVSMSINSNMLSPTMNLGLNPFMPNYNWGNNSLGVSGYGSSYPLQFNNSGSSGDLPYNFFGGKYNFTPGYSGYDFSFDSSRFGSSPFKLFGGNYGNNTSLGTYNYNIGTGEYLSGMPSIFGGNYSSSMPYYGTYSYGNNSSNSSSSGQIDYASIYRRQQEEQKQRELANDTTRFGATTTEEQEQALRQVANKMIDSQGDATIEETHKMEEEAGKMNGMFWGMTAGTTLLMTPAIPNIYRSLTCSDDINNLYKNYHIDRTNLSATNRELNQAMLDSKNTMQKLEKAYKNGKISENTFKTLYSQMGDAIDDLAKNPGNKAALETLKNTTQVAEKCRPAGWTSRAWHGIKGFFGGNSTVPEPLSGNALNAQLEKSIVTSKQVERATQDATRLANWRTKLMNKKYGQTGAKLMNGFSKFGKGFKTAMGGKGGIAFAALQVGTIGFSLFQRAQSGEKVEWGREIGRESLNLVGSLGGFAAGQAIGAAIGTAICPGIGTAVGMVVGSVVSHLATKVTGWLGKKIFGDPTERQVEEAKKQAKADPNKRAMGQNILAWVEQVGLDSLTAEQQAAVNQLYQEYAVQDEASTQAAGAYD